MGYYQITALIDCPIDNGFCCIECTDNTRAIPACITCEQPGIIIIFLVRRWRCLFQYLYNLTDFHLCKLSNEPDAQAILSAAL